jgi:hypothetical protein
MAAKIWPIRNRKKDQDRLYRTAKVVLYGKFQKGEELYHSYSG